MDNLDITLTGTHLIGGNDEWNKLFSSTSESWPSTPALPSFGQYFSNRLLAPELLTVPSNPGTRLDLYSRPAGSTGYMIPVNDVSGQDDWPRSSALWDSRKWSPPPRFTRVTPCVISSLESQFFSDDSPGGFMEAGHISIENMVETPQAVFHARLVPDLSSQSFDSMSYHPATLDADLDRDALLPSCLTQDIADNERQSSAMIYRPPKKKLSSRRGAERGCTINIESLRIDKDDLDSGARMISVHECQWAKSTDPCGMWIIGDRSCIGSHIRKWHIHTGHAENMAKCMWEGCGKTMLKESMNRHVMTVHLREVFHCQGCSCTFSRKDVYNRHVEENENCRGEGAAMLYGTGSRVIDTRRVLQQEE